MDDKLSDGERQRTSPTEGDIKRCGTTCPCLGVATMLGKSVVVKGETQGKRGHWTGSSKECKKNWVSHKYTIPGCGKGEGL